MNEAERKLVEALRSGKYQQGYRALFYRDPDQNEKYCCLGVACDISGLGAWVGWKYLGNQNLLPLVVQNQLGWSSPSGVLTFEDRNRSDLELTGLNDSGEFSFSQIADIIEAGLVK